jgi:hypothetical protein
MRARVGARMSPFRALLLATAVLLAASALPSPAVAGSWGGERAATRAGEAFEPSVAADARGRISIGWARRLVEQRRAEVRRGTLRESLRGPALVLDRTTGNLDSVTVALSGDSSLLAVAWRRLADRAQRLFASTVTLGGTVRGPQALSPDGPGSAFFPRYAVGAAGRLFLVWDFREFSVAAELEGTRFGLPFALPAGGAASSMSLAVDPDGTMVAVWTDAGRVLTASRPPGGDFGATTVLSASGYAREAGAVVTDGGDVVAAWLSSTGEGNAVLAAARPRGGAFGAPFEVAGRDQRAFSPRLAATSAGEVLVAWVNTNVTRGFGSARGIVRVQRLGGDERPVGRRIRLSPNGARALEPALTHDGIGSAHAAWTDSARRVVQARRLAPGGITGPVRTLTRTADTPSAPALAGAAGQAVAAWVASGDVRYRIYR